MLDAEELPEASNKEEASKDEVGSKAADALWEWPRATGGSSDYSPEDNLAQRSCTDSLQEYLLWQLDLTPFSDLERMIAIYVIDSTDDEGYLTQSVSEIFARVDRSEVTEEDIEKVIQRVQQFDPVGVASRNLQECLLVQLVSFAPKTPWLAEAKHLLENHLDVMMAKDFRMLSRRSRLKDDELRQVMQLIQTLNPKPGMTHNFSENQFVVPDVYMRKAAKGWKVELNPSSTPRININQTYASLVNSGLKKSDSQFIKSHLQEAKWFSLKVWKIATTLCCAWRKTSSTIKLIFLSWATKRCAPWCSTILRRP